jgi:transcriptional regulator with XRE-family HTH domain
LEYKQNKKTRLIRRIFLMGRSRREHPKRLATKLREVRIAAGLTQEEMATRLRKTKLSTVPGHVSEFERGLREPTLLVLLRYARIGGVTVDALIDDEIDLPRPSAIKGKKEKKRRVL